jgi:hypothetical protein
MKSTIDHDTIKNWVNKWGGTPAIGGSTEDQSGKGILRINFGNLYDGEPISWDEFFDIFEADRLVFRYSDEVIKGNEELAFSFVDRDKTPPLTDDETVLPETNRMAEENMYDNFDPNQMD